MGDHVRSYLQHCFLAVLVVGPYHQGSIVLVLVGIFRFVGCWVAVVVS